MSRWAYAERQMRVRDGFEKTIVFVGRSAPRGGAFIPYGTAFLMADPIGDGMFQNIVTARHVIDDITGTDEILLRVNTHDGVATTIKTERQWWFSPLKDIDLSFCPGRFSPERFDILHISATDILDDAMTSKLETGVGEDIVICGMYLSRIGETRNLPIVRSGTIAAMPSEKIRTSYGYHDVYLIESRSTGGLSGSPVFLQVPPLRFVNEDLKNAAGLFPQYFMGMVLGHNKLSYPPELLEFLPPDDREPEDRADDDFERSVPLNTGIAIVLPAPYIVQAIRDPEIVEMRKEAMERKRKRAGYVPDSAIHVAGEEIGPAEMEQSDRPDHREAFNRLVSEAAKKRPRADQT